MTGRLAVREHWGVVRAVLRLAAGTAGWAEMRFSPQHADVPSAAKHFRRTYKEDREVSCRSSLRVGDGLDLLGGLFGGEADLGNLQGRVGQLIVLGRPRLHVIGLLL